MPSLLIVSVFCHFVFKSSLQLRDFLILGLLAGLSLWFRQTTIILLAGLVCVDCLKNYKAAIIFIVGIVLGLFPKLISNFYVYGDAFYSKNYEAFALDHAVDNLAIYAFITLLLLPGGLILTYLYKGQKRKEIILSVTVFLLVHLFYRYNAASHGSFLSSVFYNGRYFIPSLALFAVVYAWHGKQMIGKYEKWIMPWTVLCIVGIFAFAFAHNILGKEYKQIGQEFFNTIGENDVPVYSNKAYRYLNPAIGRMEKAILLRDLDDIDPSNVKQDIVYLHAFKRKNSKRKVHINKPIEKLKSKFVQHKIEKEQEFQVSDNTIVIFYRLSPLAKI